MKSATVFLVALTVFTTLFLESSTAAVDSTSQDTIIVNDSVKKSLDDLLTVNAGLIASAKEDADNALLTAEGDDKEVFGSVSDWLYNKGQVIIELHNEMDDALSGGSLKVLVQVSDAITDAIAVKKTEWAALIETVSNGELKTDLNGKVITNFGNADLVDVALKGVICQSQ
ncbi:uncharacterized protein [Maniola hyperantus]|uniref:uncharacterized protein n=1 Tax=Aphantopus hyperantus TaxID=2795564 RepID=UPI002126AD46